MSLSVYEAVYEAVEEFGEDQIDAVTIKLPKEGAKRPRTRLRVKTRDGKTYEYVKLSPGVFAWRKRIIV